MEVKDFKGTVAHGSIVDNNEMLEEGTYLVAEITDSKHGPKDITTAEITITEEILAKYVINELYMKYMDDDGNYASYITLYHHI